MWTCSDAQNEVRAGPQMRKVFEYLRSPSRFPGFEDVWLDIVQVRPLILSVSRRQALLVEPTG